MNQVILFLLIKSALACKTETWNTITRMQLKNGLTLVVAPNKSSTTIAFQTWFDVGSRMEEKRHTGLAHLFEHMMFKGTKLYPHFDHILERDGFQGMNAFTSYDYTAYIQELPQGALDRIMELEADRMKHLVITTESLATEIDVVHSERHLRTENSPDGLMQARLFETAFKKHPYHTPVIGLKEDLDRTTVRDAQNFYKKYYQPQNAHIIITGNVDPNEICAKAEKYYGALPAQAKRTVHTTQEPVQTAFRDQTMFLTIPQEKLLLAYKIPASKDRAHMAALNTLAVMLGSGQSALLRELLIVPGIASSAEAICYESHDPGLFIIGVDLQKGHTALEASELIESFLGHLSITPRALTRAKNFLDADWYGAMEAPPSFAHVLGKYEILAESYKEAFLLHEREQALTVSDVQQSLKSFFQKKLCTRIQGRIKK